MGIFCIQNAHEHECVCNVCHRAGGVLATDGSDGDVTQAIRDITGELLFIPPSMHIAAIGPLSGSPQSQAEWPIAVHICSQIHEQA